MDDEKRGLLLELREHISDCDCNRFRHFKENGYNKTKSKTLDFFKTLCFIITISCAVFVITMPNVESSTKESLQWAVAGLGVISITLELFSYIYNYDKHARDHWLAAQAYASLYRKCQFFCSLYYNSSIEIWREKLDDIAEEIGRINLISPSLHEKSYDEWREDIKEHPHDYPVNHYLENYNSHINEIIDDTKNILYNHEYKIYLYGSYVQNMFGYDDIDIAIVIFDLDFDSEIQNKIYKMSLNYLEDNKNIDINIIFKDELKSNINKQYYKNIISGKVLFSSPNAQRDLNASRLSNQGYKVLALSYKKTAASIITTPLGVVSLNTYRALVNDIFYMYYNTFAFILSSLNIDWDGESSCISKFKSIIYDKDKKISDFGVETNQLGSLVEHAFNIYKYKQKVYLQADTKNINDLVNYFNNDCDIIKELCNH